MELSRVPVKRVQIVLPALLANARRKIALLKARRLVDRRQVLESQPVQAKLKPPQPVLAVWRSDPP